MESRNHGSDYTWQLSDLFNTLFIFLPNQKIRLGAETQKKLDRTEKMKCKSKKDKDNPPAPQRLAEAPHRDVQLHLTSLHHFAAALPQMTM